MICFECWKCSSTAKTESASEEGQTGYWETNLEVIALKEMTFDEDLNEDMWLMYFREEKRCGRYHRVRTMGYGPVERTGGRKPGLKGEPKSRAYLTESKTVSLTNI